MKAVRRAWQIGAAALSFAAWSLARRWRLVRPAQTPGQRFADALQRLGATFVKLGQHLSLRPDLLPADYIEALQQLQDHVLPFSAAAARSTIEAALGAPIATVFASLEPEPFAAASIAQVHGATLPNGRAVIVKVRRPGIAEQIDRDMRMAMLAARAAAALLPAVRPYRPAELIKEVWHNLEREIDFRLEARNVLRVAEALREVPGIKVPALEEGLCRDAVLVMERSHGIRVDEVHDPALGRTLAQRFIDAYVHQFFHLGVFHGDPHPGNLFVAPEGALCFHDFGIVGTLDKSTRRALAGLMLAFVEQDVDWVLDAWFDMGVLAQAGERAAYRRVVAALLDDFSRMPLAQWSLGEAFARLIAAGRGADGGVPSNLLVLGRTMLLMESTVRTLDPEFRLLDALISKARDVSASTIGIDDRQTSIGFAALPVRDCAGCERLAAGTDPRVAPVARRGLPPARRERRPVAPFGRGRARCGSPRTGASRARPVHRVFAAAATKSGPATRGRVAARAAGLRRCAVADLARRAARSQRLTSLRRLPCRHLISAISPPVLAA